MHMIIHGNDDLIICDGFDRNMMKKNEESLGHI